MTATLTSVTDPNFLAIALAFEDLASAIESSKRVSLHSFDEMDAFGIVHAVEHARKVYNRSVDPDEISREAAALREVVDSYTSLAALT